MKKSSLLFAFIVFTAILLRFYHLGSNPPSIDWDEASLGYNAYSILKTGADEYGSFLPTSFRSFEDYKPPVYVYMAVPSVALFGLSEFSVRLPAAVIGVLLVIVVYFLSREIFSSKKIQLLSAFLVAISPWSLQFSRAAFEGHVGLFFFTLGVLLFLKGLKNPGIILLSSVSFGLSVYSYHSFRLLVPIFVLIAVIMFYQKLSKRIIYLIGFFIIGFIMALPVLHDMQSASSRLSMVTQFGSHGLLEKSITRMNYDIEQSDPIGQLLHNRRVVYALSVVKGYLDHFDPVFLFVEGDGGRQHHAVDMGMLYLTELPFIILGLFFASRNNNRKITLLLIWLLLSPMPSAITTGTPHPVRAIAMMVPLHIFAALGVINVIGFLVSKKNYVKTSIALVSFAFLANFLYYFHQYYVHTPIEYGDFWQYGYKEVMSIAKENERSIDKIVVTYQYDQPYIYYLFYNRVDPSWYQKNWDFQNNGKTERFRRIIGKYEFRNIAWDQDSQLKNVLIFASPKEVPENVETIREILFPDGSVAFKVIKI